MQSSSLTEMPRSADAFVDSVGVNTHFHATGTPYVTNFTKVRSTLGNLGVRHFRDSLLSDSFNSRFEQIAAMGIHADLATSYNQTMSEITAYPKEVPNVTEAIEAPNEYSLQGGSNWVANITAFEKRLYASVKSSPYTSSLPVVGPSLTSYRDYSALGNLSAYLDYGNMHNYFAKNNPGTAGGTPFPVGKYGSLGFFIGSAKIESGSKPLMTTETGYIDNPSLPNAVTPSVKLRYMMRELFMQFNARIARTYIYALVDEADSLGITDINVNPKPVYVGVSNLLHKLADPGAIVLRSLTYKLSADPSVMHTLLQKRDGSYEFVSWIETAETDPVVPKQSVTLQCSTHFGTVAQYIWRDDGSIQTVPLVQHADGTISYTATDRISYIELIQ